MASMKNSCCKDIESGEYFYKVLKEPKGKILIYSKKIPEAIEKFKVVISNFMTFYKYPIIVNPGIGISNNLRYLVFDNEDEARRCLLFFQSPIFNYFVKIASSSGQFIAQSKFINLDYIYDLSIPADTFEDLYIFYQFTPEEIEEIINFK